MVDIYLDSADLVVMRKYAPRVQGFTTNPSLMRKAGVHDYVNFAKAALDIAEGKPISFEVTDRDQILRQVDVIRQWGPNTFAKVPVADYVVLALQLWHARVNVTGVFTKQQIHDAAKRLGPQNILSVFAGRIADTGRDPCVHMRFAADRVLCKVLWASAREVLNVRQAEWCSVDIITLSPELIDKLDQFDRDLIEYSRETADQFYKDGAGYVF